METDDIFMKTESPNAHAHFYSCHPSLGHWPSSVAPIRGMCPLDSLTVSTEYRVEFVSKSKGSTLPPEDSEESGEN